METPLTKILRLSVEDVTRRKRMKKPYAMSVEELIRRLHELEPTAEVIVNDSRCLANLEDAEGDNGPLVILWDDEHADPSDPILPKKKKRKRLR